MAKYLITGGCGFIGTHLTQALIQQGHSVVVIDNLSNSDTCHPEAEFIQEDIIFLDKVQQAFEGCGGCFHLAAIPTVEMNLDQWFSIHEVNLQGSLNVFKAAINAGNVPVVYASTCGVYGDSQQLPLDETQFIRPLSAYGCDKLSMELNAFFLGHVYQLPSLGLRIFNVYGPGQKPTSPYSGVITNFITNIIQKQPVTIYGDGEQTRDFVFVQDVVQALMHAMQVLNRQTDVVNICTGNSISINELLAIIHQTLPKHHEPNYLAARAYDVQDSCGDPTKMHTLGITMPTLRQEGIEKTIAYFQSELGW